MSEKNPEVQSDVPPLYPDSEKALARLIALLQAAPEDSNGFTTVNRDGLIWLLEEIRVGVVPRRKPETYGPGWPE